MLKKYLQIILAVVINTTIFSTKKRLVKRIILFSILIPFFNVDATFAQPYKLVALGSSTTAGFGATTMDSSWVGRLKKYYECRLNQSNVVFNLGRSGYDNYFAMPTGYIPPPTRPNPDAAFNVSKACIYLNDLPNNGNGVVIINYPTNNFDKYSIPEIMISLQVIYDSVSTLGHRCFITTTQPRTDINFDNSVVKKKLSLIKDSIIQRFGAANTINFWDGMFNAADTSVLPEYSFGDFVHFNDAGHRVLFERVLAKNVFNLPVWYAKSTGNLNELTTWGSNKDGSGNNPASFSQDFAEYYIEKNLLPTINANWFISGINVRVIVGDGINPVNLKIPAAQKITVSSLLKINCF